MRARENGQNADLKEEIRARPSVKSAMQLEIEEPLAQAIQLSEKTTANSKTPFAERCAAR
jgi:hypothetical protein